MEAAQQPDLMGKPFAGSLLAHAAVLGLLFSAGLFHPIELGSRKTTSGAVGVNMVSSIPIPQREGPKNPLANDSKSVVPQAPIIVKQEKVEAPPKDAIPLPGKVEKKKPVAKPEPPRLYVPPVQYKQNQIYSQTPQATTSPMFGMRGSGGVDLGPNSVFGSRFGAYADLLQDRIAQHWNTAGLNVSPRLRCAVKFTIGKNGSVSKVQLVASSGNVLLDDSATRALLDSNPLPPLPQGFGRDEATIQIWFQMKQ